MSVERGRVLRRSSSEKANLVFPVARVHRHLRKGMYTKRVSLGAGIYLAAVLEYLAAEVLQIAGESAYHSKRARIRPKDIALAASRDSEIRQLLSDVVIASGGIDPRLELSLVYKQGMSQVKNFPYSGMASDTNKNTNNIKKNKKKNTIITPNICEKQPKNKVRKIDNITCQSNKLHRKISKELL